MSRSWSVWLLGCMICLVVSPLYAAQNMIGRQSQNEGMLALPAPKNVAIDGDLKDWDWSGRIWSFADYNLRSRYSVQTAAMWDKEYLYMAAKWKDPTPMNGNIDPAVNAREGWKADAWQMRVKTDGIFWLTLWYSAPKKQAVVQIDRWNDDRGDKVAGTTVTMLVGDPDSTDLGQGVLSVYKADADGQGFIHEVRIPWKLIYKQAPVPKAGDVLRCGEEFLWADATGHTWPVHRYADNMQPGKTSREFFWTAKDNWGDIKLVDKGPVPVREYISDTGRVEGTIPVRVSIPQEAARFTVVLEDAQGKRIRTLAADCDPADYVVKGKSTAKGQQLVEVKWDGLDDDGKLVQPGSYTVRGLSHNGIGAEYDLTFYNPGTPPWQTADTSGAWGADHTGPIAVAAAGQWTAVTFPYVEGGDGIIGIDATGRKRWGEKRGTTLITGDDKYLYAYCTGYGTPNTLARFEVAKGTPRAFMLNGKERVFDLPLKTIFDTEEAVLATGLAVHNGTLALATNTGVVALLDATSAVVQKRFTVKNPGGLAYSRDGKLYGLIDGAVCQIDTNTGATSPITTPGLGLASALAIDLDGNILVTDIGPDSQVKAYTPAGKLAYTCGKKGGRPLVGTFDPQAMVQMSSVAVDARGNVWVVEHWEMPRRVSIWGKDGKLVRDYVGNGYYAGSGLTLHDENPDLGYLGPMEFKLNHADGSWQVSRILWLPTTENHKNIQEIGEGKHFRRTIDGVTREYLYFCNTDIERGLGHYLLMERNGKFQPVAAIGLAGQLAGSISRGTGYVLSEPTGELAGLNGYDIVFWNDLNQDGKLQRAECTVVCAAKLGNATTRGAEAFSLRNLQGATLDDDLSLYTANPVTRWKPLRYIDGAPVYGLEGRSTENYLVKDAPEVVPVVGENRLLFLGSPKLVGYNQQTKTVDWSYPNPYHSVHGSHNATMPKPGSLIGPLRISGVTKINDTVGNVLSIRGNLGQDFFYTTDGLYIGALFQDGRLPNEGLPDSVDRIKGMPMESLSEGGEPFNGWFGKQDDGTVRLATSMARQACMVAKIKGLESIRRFSAGTVKINAQQIVLADADNARRAVKTDAAKAYTITRLAVAPKIDGDVREWAQVPAMAITRDGQPDRADVRLAYDAQNLYAYFDVQDVSPWKNLGNDFTRLFKTGDALDLQFSTQATAAHRDPVAGDKRVLIANYLGKPAAILMAPVDPAAPATARRVYTSPVGTKKFDRVELLSGAQFSVKLLGNRYQVEVALPLSALGLMPQPGQALRGDLGFISSDAQGMFNTARTNWANPHTNLVNDEPLESWLTPDTWGTLTFGQ